MLLPSGPSGLASGLTSAAAAVSLSVVLTCVMAPPAARAQIGSDCADGLPCAAHQECVRGYCGCLEGFVRHPSTRACLPERAFNETCEFDDQCVDFRLKCSSQGLCACVKYYHWDEYSKQCLTLKDLKYMLNDMEEKHHSAGRVVYEAHVVFMGMLWTGLAVMIIGLTLASGCLVYGCCSGRLCCCPRDKMSSRCKPSCSSEQSQRTRETTVPSSRTNTGRLNRPVSQGAGIDYIPALYETTSFNVV